ncbi:MAG: CHAT domain-containing protein [Cyanobacteria bacterium J06621_15]
MKELRKNSYLQFVVRNLARFGLTGLLGIVLVGESVNAIPRSEGLQVAQQGVFENKEAIRKQALKLITEGRQLSKQGNAESLKQAISKWKQALELLQQLGELKSSQSLVFYSIGSSYSNLGEKQKALLYFNQALALARDIDDKFAEASILNNIGAIYNYLGDKQQALEIYNQALVLSQEIDDKGAEVTILNNIGGIHNDLGDKQQALKLYRQVLTTIREIRGDKRWEAGSLNNIGQIYDSLGEKQQALEYYKQALNISEKIPADKDGQAITLNNIATLYSSLGKKRQALTYYKQVLSLLKTLGYRTEQAIALHNIGSIHLDLGDEQQALKSLNQALLLSREVENKNGEAATLNAIGEIYNLSGDNQQALKFYNQALVLRRKVEDKSGEAVTLNNIGSVYSYSGENRKALEYFYKALMLKREVEDKSGEAKTLHNIATTYRDSNLQKALTNSKAAVDIIEKLRTKVDSNELRTSYFATVQDIYKLHIDILMQLHKQNPSKGYDAQALHASEKYRARGLLELLTEANADIRKGVNPQLVAQEKRLQQLINSKEKLRLKILSDKNKSDDLISKYAVKRLKNQVQNHINELNKLKAKIKTTSPKYTQLKYPQPLDLVKIQQQLDKDTVLLQYSLGEKHSYLWAVTPDSLHSYELPKAEDIETVANKFRNLLQDPSMQGLSPKETGETATELSKLILAPVADKLGQKRLVIVGDDALKYIPFAALADLNSSQGKQKQVNYQPLIINHEIVHLPSASTIDILREETANRPIPAKTLAVLADPVFLKNDGRITNESNSSSNNIEDIDVESRSLGNFDLDKLYRLPQTRTEAEAILKLVSPENSLKAFDFDANYNWATQKQLRNYRYLHFATHGFVHTSNPQLSGIVLSLFDKQGNPQNEGFLRLHELFNLDFPAELVVLSACKTGLGKEVKGEGLVGLTRGLMYAGAERVVMSLWDVKDDATASLMRDFYQGILQQGKSPATALREAQLKMWNTKKWRNPYSWAAFTIQGEWN